MDKIIYPQPFPLYIDEKIELAIYDWLHDLPKEPDGTSPYSIVISVIHFDYEDDATAYKLKFNIRKQY